MVAIKRLILGNRNKASQYIITSVVFNIAVITSQRATLHTGNMTLLFVRCLDARYIGIKLCHDIDRIECVTRSKIIFIYSNVNLEHDSYCRGV